MRRLRAVARLAVLAAAPITLGGIWACRGEPAAVTAKPDQAVVARVAGEPILRAEIEDADGAPRRADSQQRLDAAIARRLAAGEARRRGLDETPEVRSQIEAIRRGALRAEEALLRDALFEAVRADLELTEEEIRAHHEATQARYFVRQIRLRRQRFETEAQARAAEAALGSAGRLDPASSEAIGPAGPASLPREVLPDALRLKTPGERVVVGKGSWAIVELVEVMPAVPQPVEAVRERVEESLRRVRAEAEYRGLLERLRAEAEIEVDEAALAGATSFGEPSPKR